MNLIKIQKWLDVLSLGIPQLFFQWVCGLTGHIWYLSAWPVKEYKCSFCGKVAKKASKKALS